MSQSIAKESDSMILYEGILVGFIETVTALNPRYISINRVISIPVGFTQTILPCLSVEVILAENRHSPCAPSDPMPR